MCTYVYVFYFKIKRVFDNHKFAAADAISKSDYLSKASVGILVQFVVNFTSKGGRGLSSCLSTRFLDK